MADSPAFEAADLRALARKYQALARLRTRRDEGGTPATRAELRALAAEFPGCLRELDTLGPAEIARRAALCTEAAAGAGAGPEPEPWMAWIAGYHRLMAKAFAARARPGGRRPRRGDDLFVRAALAPTGGRLNVVVLRTLAAEFDVPATTIAHALFPVRRPSPYRL
jgi:hypothetical protein